jgi:hypothetical protein
MGRSSVWMMCVMEWREWDNFPYSPFAQCVKGSHVEKCMDAISKRARKKGKEISGERNLST